MHFYESYRIIVFLDAQKNRLWCTLPSDDRDGLEFVLGVLGKALSSFKMSH